MLRPSHLPILLSIASGLFEGFGPFVEILFSGFSNAAEEAEDEVLAVGFEEEGVLVLAEGGFDEDIGEFGLESGGDVDLGLLDGDETILVGVAFYEDWKEL